jgi:hypothetical protein
MITLSLNILDIVQNSVRAKADEISIEINESEHSDLYRIVVKDNGVGISEDILDNVTDPFITTRTKRRMGLGLPLLKYHAELAAGNLKIESEKAKGTKITALFSFSHIDRQPLGDIAGVLKILIAANPDINFIYRHVTDKGDYRFSSGETKQYLGAETLYDNCLMDDICSMIEENLKEINVSGCIFKEKGI